MTKKRFLLCFLTAILLLPVLKGEEVDLSGYGITPNQPFSFKLNDQTLRQFAADPTVEVTQTQAENKEEYRFARGSIITRTETRVDEASGLKMTIETTTYSDQPGVVEWLAWFENISDHKSPNLRDLYACDITLATGGEVTLWHGMEEVSDPKLNYSYQTDPLPTGEKMFFTSDQCYPTCYAFPYFRLSGKNKCYTVAIGWPGTWGASFETLENGDVRFKAGQKMTDFYLNPGEKVRTARVTVLAYSPEDEPVNVWRDWYREYILPRRNGKIYPPRLLVDPHVTGELYMEATEATVLATIGLARSKGFSIEGLWMDAGWYLRPGAPKVTNGYWFGTGDWTPDPERFPNGLKPIADALGPDADFVLWYEPERIFKTCVNMEAYRKYVIDLELVDSYKMNMTNPETVEFLSNLIGNSIRENGVRVYRQDSNGYGPGPFIEHLEKTDPQFIDSRGKAENYYIQGYQQFWKNLGEMNPGLVFDICASGGRRCDLDTMRFGAFPLHYSDVGLFDPVNKQRNIDFLDQWFMYYKNHDSLSWNEGENTYSLYRGTVGLAPCSTITGIYTVLYTPEFQHYFDRYFAVRDLFVSSDYYLLRGGFDKDTWTVSEYNDPEAKEGFLRVIRNKENEEPEIVVQLKGLNENARYEVNDLDAETSAEYTGRELMTTGLKIASDKKTGRVIRYQQID